MSARVEGLDKVLRALFFGLLMLSCAACANGDARVGGIETSGGDSVTDDVTSRNVATRDDHRGDWACLMAEGLPETWDAIAAEYLRLPNSFDDCAFEILDSLADRMSTPGTDRFLILADSLACVVDGVMAEMFAIIWHHALRGNAEGIVRYLNARRGGVGSCLELRMIRNIAREIEDPLTEASLSLREVDSIFSALEVRSSMSVQERAHAARLKRAILSYSAK